MPRESAAMVLMRRQGQSINNMAAFFGRSTSYIRRILKFNRCLKDLRKIPSQIRRKRALYQRLFMENLRLKWESWILGEGERPP
jgi:hypothetical protein